MTKEQTVLNQQFNENLKLLTGIIEQQTVTIAALTKVSESLIDKVTKLEISKAIDDTLKAQANE
jgi:hypothetical protein